VWTENVENDQFLFSLFCVPLHNEKSKFMEPSRVRYQVNPPDPLNNFCAPCRKSTYALALKRLRWPPVPWHFNDCRRLRCFRGGAESDGGTRPDAGRPRRAPRRARPQSPVCRDHKLRRRPGLEDRRLPATQARRRLRSVPELPFTYYCPYYWCGCLLWLAYWTQPREGPGLNRSRDAVG